MSVEILHSQHKAARVPKRGTHWITHQGPCQRDKGRQQV